MKDILERYNALIPIMIILENDGDKIWNFHNSTLGYGFHVILDKHFITIDAYEDYYSIVKNEKTGNILLGKELERERVYNIDDVYETIKRFKKEA